MAIPEADAVALASPADPGLAGPGLDPDLHAGLPGIPVPACGAGLVGRCAGCRGAGRRALWPTLLSIAVFLPLFFVALSRLRLRQLACMLGIAALGYALLPFNPFANTYLIYACGFAATLGGPLWRRMAWMAAMFGVLLLEIAAAALPGVRVPDHRDRRGGGVLRQPSLPGKHAQARRAQALARRNPPPGRAGRARTHRPRPARPARPHAVAGGAEVGAGRQADRPRSGGGARANCST